MFGIIAISFSLLVILASLAMIAKSKKDSLGKFYLYTSYSILVVGFILFLCSLGSLHRMHYGHYMSNNDGYSMGSCGYGAMCRSMPCGGAMTCGHGCVNMMSCSHAGGHSCGHGEGHCAGMGSHKMHKHMHKMGHGDDKQVEKIKVDKDYAGDMDSDDAEDDD